MPRRKKTDPGQFETQFELPLFDETPEPEPEPEPEPAPEEEAKTAPELPAEPDSEPPKPEHDSVEPIATPETESPVEAAAPLEPATVEPENLPSPEPAPEPRIQDRPPEPPAPEPQATAKPLILKSETQRRRVFLDWKRPLLESAVDFLTDGWEGGTLDLSDRLIVVPTRHASRRLREALAIRASERDGSAVIPPITVTPDFFTSPERLPHAEEIAGRAETLLAWTATLLELPMDQFRSLFPVDPVDRNLSWALKTAADLLRVRQLLGEAGLSFNDAARILGPAEMEPERWRELARLERRAILPIEKAGLIDRQVARRDAAVEGRIPPDLSRITVLATPDPTKLAIDALLRLAWEIPTEIVIYAPKELDALFDSWGRPRTSDWHRQTIDIPDPARSICQGVAPAQQAERAIELIRPHRDPGGTIAIGVPDPEVIPPLEKALASEELGAYDPAGRRLSGHSLFHLLRTLHRLVLSRSFTAFAEMLRCLDASRAIRRFIELETKERPPLTALLSDFDDLQNDHLPDSIDDAARAAKRHFHFNQSIELALHWAADWVSRFERDPFGTALTEFLGEVYQARTFQADKPDDAVFSAIADQINQALDALENPLTDAFSEPLDPGNRFELLFHLLEDESYYLEREPNDVDLQGWLELLWEDAPHLVVTGMNDGKVPEAIIGHAYLPDSARAELGIRNNDSRLARDIYQLKCLIESRRESGGRVDLIFGRVGAGDDPLRPSRLLFYCPDDELPRRVRQSFETPAPDSQPMPWEFSFALRPEPPAEDLSIFSRLYVTAFRSFLACPFRFYLNHGLRMHSVETGKTEMDARDFGNVCHKALQRFALDETARTLSDAEEIRAWFGETLDALFTERYGEQWTVPVLIQRRAAGQRLDWWAEIEAEQRGLGWEIVEAEFPISPRDESRAPFTLGGFTISGSIDRIECHPDKGVRIIDFKTGRRRFTVEENHLARIKRTESPEDFLACAIRENSDGHASHWIDLQLPLYRLATQKDYPAELIHVAYGNLGPTRSDISLDTWDTLDRPTLESARVCAVGVIEAIHERTFWPPAEKVRYDDFAGLFFGDAESAIDPTLFLGEGNPVESTST